MSDAPKGSGSDDFAAGIEEITDDISDVSWLDIPVLIVFAALFVIVALQFFTRYVLNDSMGWTEEIARYFLIILGFVGSITCVRRQKHIFLEFFFRYLSARVIKPIVVATEVLVLGFFGYAGVLGIELAERTTSNMISIPLPKAIIFYIVVVSCFLMAVFSIINIVRLLRQPADRIAAERHKSAGA